MIRSSILVVLVVVTSLVPALSAPRATAVSSPAIRGSVDGLEWCIQSICGTANFVGLFAGEIGEAPASGMWSIRVSHEALPDEPGSASNVIGGGWWLMTARGAFWGTVVSGTIVNNGDNTFAVDLTLALVAGGVGTISAAAILNHNRLPPTVQGTLGP